MPKVTSIRLPDELVDDLDRIAQSLDRSRGWVIRQALTQYVQEQETDVSAMQAAIGELEGSSPLSNAHRKVIIAALEHMIEDAVEKEPEPS
jgi:predicted transcriptional regulator